MTAEELRIIKAYVDEKVAYEVNRAIAQVEGLDEPDSAALREAEERLVSND